MILERYAFYSKGYATPQGNFEYCFHIGDDDEPPVIDGVEIPRRFYEVRTELEINFSHCTIKQFQGILCKYIFRGKKLFHRSGFGETVFDGNFRNFEKFSSAFFMTFVLQALCTTSIRPAVTSKDVSTLTEIDPTEPINQLGSPNFIRFVARTTAPVGIHSPTVSSASMRPLVPGMILASEKN